MLQSVLLVVTSTKEIQIQPVLLALAITVEIHIQPVLLVVASKDTDLVSITYSS